MYTIIRVIFVLFVYIKSSNSCSCLQAHPQQNFCNADFVVLAVPEVLNTVDEFTVQYKINIKETFKMKPEAKTSLENNFITTAMQSATCGIKLELHKQYLLSGTTSDGVARVNLCGWNTLWDNVKPYQEKGLRSEYEKGCNCPINPCIDEHECSAKRETSSCLLSQFGMDRLCYDEFSSCASTDGKCNWIKDEHFVSCINSNSDLQQKDISKK